MNNMNKNPIFDHKYCSYNQSLNKCVNQCHKHLDLIHKYRQLLSDLALNCVCDQNKDIKTVFTSMELLFKEVYNKNDETIDDSDYTNNGSDVLSKHQFDDTVNSGHNLSFLVPNVDINSSLISVSLQTDPNRNPEELTTTCFQSVIQTPIEVSIDSITDSNQRIKTINGYKVDKNSVESKLKSRNNLNQSFNHLMNELKNKNLEEFVDPNNKLISVYRKRNNSMESQNEWTVVFKCNYTYCEFETNQKRYIKKHVERHMSLCSKGSALKYRIFCNLLEDLKSGKIDTFIDPEYQLVSVYLKESEDTDQTVVYKCNYTGCQYESSTKYYIRNHVIRHKKNKVFECIICEEEFASKLKLIEHRIEMHNIDHDRLFQCEFPGCEFRTIVKQTFKTHSFSHQKDKPFKCDFNGCDMYFKSQLSVRVHQNSVHTSKWFSCEWPGCETRSKSRTYMKTHLATHTGESVTVGKIRNLLKSGNYVSTVDTNNHLFSVIRQQIISQSDGKIEIGPKLGYKCNHTDCKFICIAPNIISQHISGHSNGKTFECDICHKRFVLRYHMNNHKKMVHHINNKNPEVSCHLCDYRTRNAFCLRQHSFTHQIETPFKCDRNECERSFKTEANLRAHINYTHNKLRPHICQYSGCEATFKMKSQLNRHLKTHSKNKQLYSCDRCSKTFTFKSSLAKHNKKKH